MEHWLRAFRLMGLIERTASGIRIVREPGEADFALTRQQAHQPFASSYHVVKKLEREEAERSGQGAGKPVRAVAAGV